MAITHGTELRAALADAVLTFVDTGSGTAVIELFDVNGNLLIVFDLPDPAYSSNEAGTLSLNDLPLPALAIASGTATSFQVINADGDLAYQGSISAGGPTDLQMTNADLISGRQYAITAHSYSAPV